LRGIIHGAVETLRRMKVTRPGRCDRFPLGSRAMAKARELSPEAGKPKADCAIFKIPGAELRLSQFRETTQREAVNPRGRQEMVYSPPRILRKHELDRVLRVRRLLRPGQEMQQRTLAELRTEDC
jgi:hypothetical protein